VGALHDLADPYVGFAMPAGGFFLWLGLRKGLLARDVQAAAHEQGVIFPVGHAFYPAGDAGRDGERIRLAYSWTAEADLEEAVRRLSWALEQVAASSPT
jgi:GntR family transcriptional regulator